MLGEEYTLEYLPIFDEELADAVNYIAHKLYNPQAARELIDRTEAAILERLFAPESFEPVVSAKDREHTYYRSVAYLSISFLSSRNGITPTWTTPLSSLHGS